MTTNLVEKITMPSLTLSDRLIWFAHVPKAGGTSVEQALVARWGDRVGHLHWGWDLWWRGGGWRVADPPNSPQHLIWDDALRALPRAPDAVFALVRHPVERLQSEHRYRRRGRNTTRMGRALARLPFALWVRIVLAMAARNAHVFDNHLRPQSDFIPDGAAVFRLEDGLSPVADWLGRQTDTAPPTFGHALRSEALSAPVATPLLARIEATYLCDFKRFGYARLCQNAPRRTVTDRMADGLAPVLVWLDGRGRL